MATHRAYVQQELGGKVELENVSTPSPAAGEVLVDVLATPILSYTNAVLAGSLFPLVHPLTPGISAIGRIHSTGIDSTVLQTGQLVFCVPIIRARDDAGNSILHGWFGGAGAGARKLMDGPWRNGAWAEKMIVPTENVVVLGEERLLGELGYSIPQLVWLNELSVPFGGWLAADLKPASTVIVAPATGHFGSSAVRVALAMGVRKVIATGRNSDALALLQENDPTRRTAIVTLTGDVETDTANLRNEAGTGADAYLDFSPASAAGATHPNACIGALRKGGTAVLMGGVTENLALNYAHLMLGNITVRGNFMYPPSGPSQLAKLVESGLIDLKSMKTMDVAFEDLLEGITSAEKHAGASELMVLRVSSQE